MTEVQSVSLLIQDLPLSTSDHCGVPVIHLSRDDCPGTDGLERVRSLGTISSGHCMSIPSLTRRPGLSVVVQNFEIFQLQDNPFDAELELVVHNVQRAEVLTVSQGHR